jgi:hypothetical protein
MLLPAGVSLSVEMILLSAVVYGGEAACSHGDTHAPAGSVWLSMQHALCSTWMQAMQQPAQLLVSKQQQHPHNMNHFCPGGCAVLVFAAGKAFLPGSPAFATLVIWICSVTAAQIAHWVSDACSACKLRPPSHQKSSSARCHARCIAHMQSSN